MSPLRSARVAVFLALRSVLRGGYGIAALTTLMMTLIFLNLLFLPSLIQGAIDRISKQIVDTATSDIEITPDDDARSIQHVDRYLERVRATQGVASATATYRIGTEVSHGNESGAWTVEAIDPESYAEVFTTPENAIEGKYISPGAEDEAFLGIDIAGAGDVDLRGYSASLKDVNAGDSIRVTLIDGSTHRFDVSGVYENQFALSDSRAFVSMAAAESLLSIADQATAVFVRTDAGANRRAVIDRLERLGGEFEFQTSDVLAAAVKDQIDTFKLINDILKVISLGLAAITVFIVTYVDLVNRRRQIGIERAIGIKTAAILASYVLKAWVYAAVGIAVGVLALELGISPLVDRHPFQFPNGPVVLSTGSDEVGRDIVLLLIVAMISALAPGIASVRLRIVDAIWGR